MTDERFAAINRLRRLQEHNLSSMPALIAQRSVSTFSLQRETPPESATRSARVIVYPQDPFVGSPEMRLMDARDIAPGLVNARVRIEDSLGVTVQPDANGDYIYLPGTLEFDQVNTFYYTTFTLRMWERYAARALPWAFPLARLCVDPHAGSGANAFYNEQDRMLGFYRFQVNGTTFNAAESADIISHETAHAILDGIRDLYNESFSLGCTAFHESFGDITAVLVALHDGSLVDRLLDWTNGDLSVENFIAQVAEHLTEGVRATNAHVQEQTAYLRNAINHLVSLPFDELPADPADPQVQLGRESHNYSRLFTGAFYDILAAVYNRQRERAPESVALSLARDIMGSLVALAVESAPVGEFDFADMARALLTADSLLHDGAYSDLITVVFDRRKILTSTAARAHLASLSALPDLRLPETLNTALAAALFLEQQVQPTLNLPKDIELTPMAVYRNAAGYAFVTYFSYRRIIFEGRLFRQYDGAHIDAFGGLSLVFDADNHLRSACLRHVTDEDVRQIRVLVRALVEAGSISDQRLSAALPPTRALHDQPDKPKGVLVSESDPNLPLFIEEPLTPPKLVKYPVIFDSIPWHLSELGAYLRAWMKQDRMP